MVNFANAPGTNANKKSQEKRYYNFCDWLELNKFPVDEWHIVLYATYLSLTMQSVDSIKTYVETVCELNELEGFTPVCRGWLYNKAILGIHWLLQHEVNCTQPITMQMLTQMVEHIDIQDQKKLATWVAILYGFFLFLRKSNLVPVKRIHDPQHQLSRGDITYFDKVLIVEITWSKTNQFGERKLKVPVTKERLTDICPVDWLLFMVKRIPALPQHNLFSFWQDGQILPVTYRDLTVFLRELLEKI